MTKYISATTAFGATLFGFIGNTWDKDKSGISHITELGWIAFSIALISLIVSIYALVKDDKKMRWKESQRHTIRQLAYVEIRNETANLIWAFDQVFISIKGIKHEYCSVTEKKLDFMQSEALIKQLDFLNALDRVPNVGVRDWGDLFVSTSKIGNKSLSEVWLKYSLFLDEETIILMSDLVNDDFFRMRLLELEQSIEVNKQLSKLTLGMLFTGPSSHDFKSLTLYLQKLKKLFEYVNTASR